MADVAGADVDVVHIGFLLGHGGDALQMLQLADGIKQRGARVRIIVPAVPSSVTFKERCEAVAIACDRTPLISVSMQGARQNLSSMIRLLRSVRAPIVHFHSGNSALPRALMTAMELLRYRRGFATLQSPYETIAPGSLRARFWSVTSRRRLAAVVSPSQHGTEYQVRCGVPRGLAVTVRNSIDVDALGSGDPARPRQSLGVNEDQPIVLFSSRIDGQKRPLEAVRIFAGVSSEFPTARLVFVGKGDEERSVVEESARLGIAERVSMVGYQTDIPNWLAAATVWLLPTERENFSIAVLEALAAGCAILSTNCQGNDEVLVDGHNALTFAVGDVATATEQLRRLLRDPRLRADLSVNARASAQAFSVPNMVEGYRSVYQRAQQVPAALRNPA